MFLQSALNAEGQVQAVTEGTVTSFNGAQAYVGGSPLVTDGAIDAADAFSGGLRYRGDGALRIYDATNGAPAGALSLFGFLVTANGQLCVIADDVAAGGFTCGGMAVSADGRVYMAGVGSAYEGPLDLVPGAAWLGMYSQFAMSVDWTDPVIRIRETAGDTEQSFSPTDNHKVSAAEILAFLNGANGYTRTLFDQSGQETDLVQTTASLQMLWGVLAGNSLPALRGISEGVQVPTMQAAITAAAGSGFTTFTVLSVAEADAVGAYVQFLQGENDDYLAPLFIDTNTGPDVLGEYAYDGGAGFTQYLQTTTPGVIGLHILEVVVTAAGVITILIDGADIGAVLADGEPHAIAEITQGLFMQLPMQTTNPNAGNSWLQEHLICGEEMSAGDRLLIRQNQASRFEINL